MNLEHLIIDVQTSFVKNNYSNLIDNKLSTTLIWFKIVLNDTNAPNFMLKNIFQVVMNNHLKFTIKNKW